MFAKAVGKYGDDLGAVIVLVGLYFVDWRLSVIAGGVGLFYLSWKSNVD